MTSPVVVALAKCLPAEKLDDAIQLLDERGLAKLELMATEFRLIGDDLARQPIDSDEHEARASELLTRGVAAMKELDLLRRSRVDPLNAEVKAVNALFKVVSDPAEVLLGKGGKIERAILAYRQVKRARIQREQEEARRKQEEAARAEAAALAKAEAAKTAKAREKALAAAEAASEAQAVAVIEAPAAMPKGVRTDSGSVSAREAYVLGGIHDLDAVPQVYWRDPVVVEALKKVLSRAIRAGAREIPGVSIVVEEALTRRVG
jgi:hypothetical protein